MASKCKEKKEGNLLVTNTGNKPYWSVLLLVPKVLINPQDM
jgi:hypothetical protein